MKTYMVVTNDKYEYPVSVEIVGAKKVAEWLGIELGTFRTWLCRGFPKKSAYKVIIIEDRQFDDPQQYRKDYYRRYCATHDRSEYFKERYKRQCK